MGNEADGGRTGRAGHGAVDVSVFVDTGICNAHGAHFLHKRFAEQLAAGTEYEAELNLLKSIERLTPEVFAREKGSTKELCANVDMYSGFIYSMMGIPEDLFTPLFACARMAGWAAHRFEEIAAGKRIIRPAYKNTIRGTKPYVPIERR